MRDTITPPPAMDIETALRLILDHADYTAGACRANEPVGAVLPADILQIAKDALEAQKPRGGIGNASTLRR